MIIRSVLSAAGMFDRDYSGQIDVQEFQALWGYIQQWKAQFDALDRDRSGTINTDELCTGKYFCSHSATSTICGQ